MGHGWKCLGLPAQQAPNPPVDNWRGGAEQKQRAFLSGGVVESVRPPPPSISNSFWTPFNDSVCGLLPSSLALA